MLRNNNNALRFHDFRFQVATSAYSEEKVKNEHIVRGSCSKVYLDKKVSVYCIIPRHRYLYIILGTYILYMTVFFSSRNLKQ